MELALELSVGTEASETRYETGLTLVEVLELLVRTELSLGRGGTTGGREASALRAVAALRSLEEGDEASTHDAVSRMPTEDKHRSSIVWVHRIRYIRRAPL